MIYLDHNATAPLRPQAASAMQAAMGPPMNPSSIHSAGRKARQAVEEARQQIASAFGARHHDLIFTSGATESNNMVLSGYQNIITSAVEHSAILAPRPDGVRIDVDAQGVIELDALDAQLSRLDPRSAANTLVSVIAANNETGVLQPIGEIGALCARYQVAFHSDMVQMAGKMPVDLSIEGLSFASFSAHKMGGPSGIGALWIRPGLSLPPMLIGGGQEQGRRPGTENALGIIGFGAAAHAALADHAHFMQMAQWRNQAEDDISRLRDDVTLLGAKAERLPNTSAIALGQITASTALMALDMKGVCLSSGSACSSGKVKASHVITAMGQDHLAAHVLRISGGWNTTKDEFQTLVKTIATL